MSCRSLVNFTVLVRLFSLGDRIPLALPVNIPGPNPMFSYRIFFR